MAAQTIGKTTASFEGFFLQRASYILRVLFRCPVANIWAWMACGTLVGVYFASRIHGFVAELLADADGEIARPIELADVQKKPGCLELVSDYVECKLQGLERHRKSVLIIQRIFGNQEKRASW